MRTDTALARLDRLADLLVVGGGTLAFKSIVGFAVLFVCGIGLVGVAALGQWGLFAAVWIYWLVVLGFCVCASAFVIGIGAMALAVVPVVLAKVVRGARRADLDA